MTRQGVIGRAAIRLLISAGLLHGLAGSGPIAAAGPAPICEQVPAPAPDQPAARVPEPAPDQPAARVPEPAPTQQAQHQTGVLAGRVMEMGTQKPLADVRITVEATSLITLTDSAGRFRLAGVPSGAYVVRADLIGHVPAVRTDVVVRPGRVTQVALELTPSAFRVEALHVSPSYFAWSEDAPASRVGFAAEEIRRAPGSAGDVSRILYGLPAVAKVNDQSNGLAVRGGTPSENLFLVDGIAVPNINHFPAQGATSGPIGLLNVELIRDVQFQAGGFPAQHGDRLSSVMEITLRDGNPEHRAAQLSIDFTGAGAVVEGPLGDNASGIVSVRRSYLDLLVSAIDVGATVAPRFGDYTVRFSADLSPRHRVSALGLWADDRFTTDIDQALEHGMTAFGRQNLLQGTTGAAWTALWSDGWLSRTSLAHSYARFDEDYTETASRLPLFRNRSSEQSLALRHRTRVQLKGASSLAFGGDGAIVRGAFDNRYMRHVNPVGDTVAELVLDADPRGVRGGVFLTLTHAPVPSVTTSFGVRLDHATLTGNTTVSPRASLAWSVLEQTTLSLSSGLYRQSLPLLMLASPAHRDLRDPLAVHVVSGLSHVLAPGTQVTLEAYRKEYRGLPLDPTQPAIMPLDEIVLGNAFFTVREHMVDSGRAHATGIELLLQKRLTASIYALVSGAWSRARYRGLDGEWRPRAFDNGLMLSGEGGWRVGPGWELSARWIYAGGAPYTPIDENASNALERTVLDAVRVAGARYPAYHSLNVRADRRFTLRGSGMVAYISVWNAYDRANVASYYWNTETRAIAATHQWRLLPIFGIEWNP